MSTFNRNKTLDLTSVALVQKATKKRNLAERREKELAERNAKARAYSRSVQRKRKEIKENIQLILAPFGIITVLYAMFQLGVHFFELYFLLGGAM